MVRLSYIYSVIITGLMILISSTDVLARDFKVKGRVTDKQAGPVAYAMVSEVQSRKGTYTDEEGEFQLELPEGKNTLKIGYLGYKEVEIPLELKKDVTDLVIVLEESSLMMEEVVVTARQVDSRNGTGSFRIDDQAIRQIQAMTLSDVLTLLPGKKIGSVNYNLVQQADLRSAVTSASNNFGTSVIVNGMSMNNDANMQVSNPGQSLTESGSSAGRGIDLRNISAASIESVEVITGVPSAKYGNVSTGAIIIKNKSGVTPLNISASATATAYQVAFSQGYELPRGGIVNADASYCHSASSPIQKKDYYQNANVGLRWTKMLDRKLNWSNTVAFQALMGFNGQRYEPDEKLRTVSKVNSQNFMLNVYGDFTVDKVGLFSYSVNGSVDNQYSHHRDFGTGPLPLVESLETGTFITTYSSMVFKQEQIMKGLPVNLSANFDFTGNVKAGGWNFNFLTGLQYDYDKNFGKGRSIVGNVVQSVGGIGARAANFYDVPASMTFSVFQESTFSHQGKIAETDLRLGLRYDYMNLKHHLVSPRLSGKVKLFGVWSLRAAWGLAYKAPSMLEIYPGPSYFDYTNFSYYATNPAERLAVVSTYVYEPKNENLKPSHSNTVEVGMDLEWDWLTIRVTAFRKKLENAIGLSPELLLLRCQKYEVKEAPVGKPPVVVPIEGKYDLLPRKKEVMKNCITEITDGLEVTLIPAKIRSTYTEFHLQASCMRTRQINHGYSMELSKYVVGDDKSRYGIYERPRHDTYLGSGRVSLIQHFPRIGLIFTLNTELNFMDYTRPVGGSIYPYAYYDYTGVCHDLSLEERQSEAFADLVRPESSYEIKDKKPFYTNFHLQIRKETRNGHSFSLYMNNFLWLNPTYVYKDVRRTLNGIVDFGFSMSFTIGKKK